MGQAHSPSSSQALTLGSGAPLDDLLADVVSKISAQTLGIRVLWENLGAPTCAPAEFELGPEGREGGSWKPPPPASVLWEGTGDAGKHHVEPGLHAALQEPRTILPAT